MEIPDKDVLRRWLNGTCTDEEIAWIKKYMQENGPGALMQQLDKDWNEAEGAMDVPDTERLLANIRSVVQRSAAPVGKPAMRVLLWKRVAVAAAVLVAVATGAWFWLGQYHNNNMSLATQSWHTIQNTKHYKVNISLPDRSQVWLEAGTILQYATDFGSTDRRVKLTGEAFFEVTKDSLHPFIVEAGKVMTRVLGTHFNVEAWEKESFTRISLVEGKVNTTYAGADHQTVLTALLPGHRLCYNRRQASGKVEPISLDEQAYTGASIVLQDVSLNTALQRIGIHYGRSIRLQDTIQERHLFSGIVPGDNVETALSNIAFVYRLQYHIEQDTIRVYQN